MRGRFVLGQREGQSCSVAFPFMEMLTHLSGLIDIFNLHEQVIYQPVPYSWGWKGVGLYL